MPQEIMDLFPISLRQVLEKIPSVVKRTLEEVRLRENRPLEIGYDGKYGFVCENGVLTLQSQFALRPSQTDCHAFLERVTNHSLYAMEEELRRGYVTVRGGHRIGLAGRVILDKGQVSHLKDITAFNVRIARELKGSAVPVLPEILDFRQKTIQHTLIVSPPQQGKTTLIRDIARCISLGQWQHPLAKNWDSRKVGIVDERSEIAASIRGVPTFDLGPRADVLDACPKAEGMMMMLRAMSPEVLVVDEIGRKEDADAIKEAVHAGISVLATAHAANLADIKERPNITNLVSAGVFGAYIFLERRGAHVKHHICKKEDLSELQSS